MKKIIPLTFLLALLLISCGCNTQNSSDSHNSIINSQSNNNFSKPEITNNTNITPLTPLSFTEDDLELQKILQKLSNAEMVDFWFQGGAFCYIDDVKQIEIVNEDNNSNTLHYIRLPKDLKDGEFTFPYSYEELKKNC